MEPMFRATRPLSSSNRHQRRASAIRSRGKDKKYRFNKAQKDAINKAADRFAACGCDCCGAPAIPGFPGFCVPNGAEFVVVCYNCEAGQSLEPLVTVIPHVMIDPWGEDDRVWFKDNPARLLRLRKTMPGELEAAAIDFNTTIPIQLPGHFWATVSYHIRPGDKARSFRQIPNGTSIDELSDLEIAAHFLPEGGLENVEKLYDDVMARSNGSKCVDTLIHRIQSRLSFFEENFR